MSLSVIAKGPAVQRYGRYKCVLQRGEACEKYFGPVIKKPTANLEALLVGLKMTVYDTPTLNRECLSLVL